MKSGYGTIVVEYHGLPLSEEGEPILEGKPLHIRIWLGTDGGDEAYDIFQLEALMDLTREDGTCRVCRPEIVQGPTLRAVETTKPCQGCHYPIRPGELYYGGKTTPRHIGC